MAIPKNISKQTAPIYASALSFQMAGKCYDGTTDSQTQILQVGDTYDGASSTRKGWKLVALQSSSTISAITITGFSTDSTNALIDTTFTVGGEVMGEITEVTVTGGLFALYKDCPFV